jgi:carboxylesterase type B
MLKSLSILGFALASRGLTAPVQPNWYNAVQVTTGTGTYVGIINETTPDVRQFRNIPYGVAPEGDLRWLPPVAVSSGTSKVYDSTKYPPSCPQYAPYNSTASDYIAIVPELVAAPTKADQYAKTSEDCLSLAVWTPVGAEQGDALPVVMFMTGGGWQTGGIDIPYQFPHHWVQRTKSHIVVTIK